MKKKETIHEGTAAEVERLTQALTDAENSRRSVEKRFSEELNKHSETIRLLKKELLEARENEERVKLQVEERNMEAESMAC